MAENKEKLFDMFPPISTEEWLAKINVDLKGADYQKKLVWRTNEGFDVQPLYRAEDLENSHISTRFPANFPMCAAHAQTMTGESVRMLMARLRRKSMTTPVISSTAV